MIFCYAYNLIIYLKLKLIKAGLHQQDDTDKDFNKNNNNDNEFKDLFNVDKDWDFH